MKFSKFKLYYLMFFIGFLCMVLDVNINTPLHYPEKYANTKQVIGEFQYYNIASNYHAYCDYKMIDTSENDDGTGSLEPSTTGYNATAKVINNIYYKNLQVDLFNDFLGLLLIIIACFGFRKCSRGFSFAACFAILALLIHTIIVALPFLTNGLLLCYLVFFIGLAYLICTVCMFYMVAKGLFSMCPAVSCRDERKWCKILLFTISTAQILITFIFWLGADFSTLHNLGLVFQYINVLLVFAFWRVLYRAKDHLKDSYLKKRIS